ncbi:hypothetical protein COLSTE_00639 [Collinsella stercoris DSM 13279]|uniref:Uncharacterized protein n=1 Tax=Collinsella stercoris DSM 13279 TaxID=445975 RepID=B6G999_9ACTN|nr:hypothetical protein COLSTE_00639 [Collinsella stercoris DSM 13279]
MLMRDSKWENGWNKYRRGAPHPHARYRKYARYSPDQLVTSPNPRPDVNLDIQRLLFVVQIAPFDERRGFLSARCRTMCQVFHIGNVFFGGNRRWGVN